MNSESQPERFVHFRLRASRQDRTRRQIKRLFSNKPIVLERRLNPTPNEAP